MPRGGKKAHKGNHGHHCGSSIPRGGRQAFNVAFKPFIGFTLQDEARNTERHHGFWDTDQRLRHTVVNFVRAGTLESDELLGKTQEIDDTMASLAGMDIESAAEDEVISSPGQEALMSGNEVVASKTALEALPKTDTELLDNQKFFVVDVQGDRPPVARMPLRPASPTHSDSSEEVILFAGRDANGKPLQRAAKVSRTITDPIDTKIQRIEEEIQLKEELLDNFFRHQNPVVNNSVEVTVEEAADDFEIQVTVESDIPVPHRKKNSKKKGRARGRGARRRTEQAFEEDALIADYLANMDKDGQDLLQSFGKRELGGTDDELWLEETEQSSGGPQYHLSQQSGWSQDEVNDFDDLSTSDGVMGEVKAILSSRERISGVQYLVVWEEQAVDEARWVPVSSLTSVDAQLHIENFEAQKKLAAQFMSNTNSTEDSDNSDADDIEMLYPRAPGKMSDEQIARLLAKQQELGIDDDELVLFDGEANEEENDVTHASPSISAPRQSSSHRKSSKRRGKALRRANGEFPVASVLADAFDGFDVMDFDRPSLRKKSKGKLVFDLSDSELEASMTNAWGNDRIKKKQRKQEREELRAQGLLGKNSRGRPDLNQKYKEGMSLTNMKEEMKRFLNSDDTTLALPPMEKAERKLVHELANAFKIKSKSNGDGKKRFPVLYKTSHTQPYYDHTFNSLQSRMSRRFLPRADVKSGGRKADRGMGGFNNGAVSYRDGDVVGASAPELGVTNKGRAMLEKMGWSSGTALGADNNKGILQPVPHVVKTTKAGLG